jgi:hypothetical protein
MAAAGEGEHHTVAICRQWLCVAVCAWRARLMPCVGQTSPFQEQPGSARLAPDGVVYSLIACLPHQVLLTWWSFALFCVCRGKVYTKGKRGKGFH